MVLLFAPLAARAQNAVRGVDFVHPLQFSEAEQDAALARIASAGVRVIRFGMYQQDLDKNIAFIARAHTHNIAVDLILHGLYPPDAPQRPYRAKEFPNMWAGPLISSLSPELSRPYFQQLLDKLDADGIALAALEFENEINMAGDNPDFSLPGQGRVLGLNDLYHDPEGQKVAKGYLQYLKVLAALKQVRDHSRLNTHTPLLPTSVVDIVEEGPWPTPKPYDGVSVGATIAFMRANGLDQLVDAYNLHTYPWADHPGDKTSAIHRARRLAALIQPVCAAAGSAGGKPCWITEWGFSYGSKTCAADEAARSQLVQEMMGDFAQWIRERRLTGLLYYSWTGDPAFDVERCGALTRSGQAAIDPITAR
ncbi:hypothetical protein UP09_02925 [Bradyrhizobium sp. LTSP885]|nr:hypothetical protein UP09_02925 [Bradyrhizobium sp. LTSP885]